MCKFLTHLTKNLKLEDLNIVQKHLLKLSSIERNETKLMLEAQFYKRLKYFMSGYIYEILKNCDNYKDEGELL